MKMFIKPKELEKAYYTDGFYPKKIPKYIMRQALLFLERVEVAENTDEVLSYRKVDRKKKLGTLNGHYGVRLNDQWRLVFYFNESSKPVILRVEYFGKHYE